jgi:hypothetical protein
MIAIPLSWKIAIGATLVTIAFAAMWWAFSEGKDVAHADNFAKTIATQRSITDAEARGPRTPDDVDRRLRDGSF